MKREWRHCDVILRFFCISYSYLKISASELVEPAATERGDIQQTGGTSCFY